MKKINKRIDEQLGISKSLDPNGKAGRKRKEASLPPKNAKDANKIFDELWEINPVLSLCSQMQSLTGLRYSDASWLRFDDLESNDGVGYVEQFPVIQQKVFNMLTHEKYKNISRAEAIKKSRVHILVNQSIIELVEECRLVNPNSHYLFANKRSSYIDEDGKPADRPMSVNSASEHHLKISKKLKLDYPLGTHSWRKYFAKLAIDNGADVIDVRDLLGQLSLNSTNTYLHSFDDKLRPIVNKISL